jgi:hypothetical protein
VRDGRNLFPLPHDEESGRPDPYPWMSSEIKTEEVIRTMIKDDFGRAFEMLLEHWKKCICMAINKSRKVTNTFLLLLPSSFYLPIALCP